MFRLKFLFFIFILIFLTGCYESEVVIELNPDGSGVVTSILNFDRATEDQRQQVKQFLNNPNSQSSLSSKNINKNFPSPRFEVIEVEEDNENLRFKSVIKFKDINHLLSIDSDNTKLKDVNFRVEGEDLVFTIVKSSQGSGFRKNLKSKLIASELKDNIQPKETIRIIDDRMGGEIVFEHQYTGDNVEKKIEWEGRLRIADHTIKRTKVQDNFADYEVVTSPQVDVMEAKWVLEKRHNSQMAKSRLALNLGVKLPSSDGVNYLGYDQRYLLSGEFSGGEDIKLDKSWGEQFKQFNDVNNMAGSNKFRLPLNFSFPKNPVDGLEALKLRVRLLSGINLKRVDLGLLVSNQTYEAGPFVLTIKNLSNNTLSLEVRGPMRQLQNYFIKTRRGNVFPIKSSNSSNLDDRGTVGFWENYPLEGAGLIIEFYESSKPVWLDLETDKMSLTLEKMKTKKESSHENLFIQLFPQYQNVSVPENIYESKEAFERYWDVLEDEQLIPAILKVSYDVKRLKGNGYSQIYSWYQTSLGKKLKERNINHKELVETMFQLFLNMPDQNSNTFILHFLSNSKAGFLEMIRDKALQAVKDKKLRNGIDSVFKGPLSEEERKVFHEVFERSDYWVERVEIFKLLTKGEQGDLIFAQRVLREENGSNSFVRQHAFEVLLDKKLDINTAFIKSYILDSRFDWMDLQKISQRVGGSHTQGQISKRKLVQLLMPIRSILEDLAENKSGFMGQEAKKILEAMD